MRYNEKGLDLAFHLLSEGTKKHGTTNGIRFQTGIYNAESLEFWRIITPGRSSGINWFAKGCRAGISRSWQQSRT